MRTDKARIAFHALISLYGEPVRYFLERKTGGRGVVEDFDDIFEQACTYVWTRRALFLKSQRTFRGFLSTKAEALLIDWRRKHERRDRNKKERVQAMSLDSVVGPPDGHPTPEAMLLHSERQRLWQRWALSLSRRDSQIADLHFALGRSNKEIAEILELSRRTVYSRIQYLTRSFREFFAAYGYFS